MNALKTGAFISELRKEKGLTQNELAKILFVSDKAISRWETGKGFPNIEILPAIADFFGVTITEILNGERSEKELNQTDKIAESNLQSVCNEVGTANQKKKKQLKHLRIALIIMSIILVISINVSIITTLMINEYKRVVGSENCVISNDYRQLEYFGTTYLPIMVKEDTEIKPNDITLISEAQVSGYGFLAKLPFEEKLYGVDGVENNDIVYLPSGCHFDSVYYCKEEKYDYYRKNLDTENYIPDLCFIKMDASWSNWSPYDIMLKAGAVKYLAELKYSEDIGRTVEYDYTEIIYDKEIYYGYSDCYQDGTIGKIIITDDGMLFYPSVSFQGNKAKKYYLINEEYSKYFIDEIFSKDSDYNRAMKHTKK